MLVPPMAETTIDPVDAPLHPTSVVRNVNTGVGETSKVNDAVAKHASVVVRTQMVS